MATDYEAYARIKEERRKAFLDSLGWVSMTTAERNRAEEVFELLHDLRGDVMALHSDFAVDMAPDDAYVDRRVAELEVIVGPAYPQKEG